MRIIHTADMHFINNPEILKDVVKCSDFLIERAAEYMPQLTIIAGDLFHEKVYLDSPAVKSAIKFLKVLGEFSPILIIRGTKSHDQSSLESLDLIGLNTKFPIFMQCIVGQIALYKTNKFADIIDESNVKSASFIISCLPSLDKSSLVAEGSMSIGESNAALVQRLKNDINLWAKRNKIAKSLNIPTILAGHLNLTGASLSTEQTLVGYELEFSKADLQASGADIICLGHIHKPQQIDNIFYSGSTTRMNFGETEDKGFWIHEWGYDRIVSSRFIKTPARKLLNLECKSISDILTLEQEGLKDAYIKIKIEVNEAELHTIDEAALRLNLMSMGAIDVHVEKTVITNNRVRAEGIGKKNNLADKLQLWGQATQTDISDTIIQRLNLLLESDAGEDVVQIILSNFQNCR